MTICDITAGNGVSFLKHRRTDGERTANGRTDRRGSQNSYLDKSKSRGRVEKINVFFSCGEVWLAGIGFLASAIETCEQEHSKTSFCRQSKFVHIG